MKAEDARLIIDEFERDSPEVYKLALAASLAARVEPELLRAYRLKLFTALEPGAEADLWFSPMVQSQTPLALQFEPEALELLRSDLAGDQELLQRAWDVLREFHGTAPFALRLQEELTWLGLSKESPQALIEQRLHAVLTEVRAGKRMGLARWASRALPTLPDKARETEAARRLSVVVGMQTGIGPVLSAMPTRGMNEDWLNEVTAKKILRVKVGVRLLKNDTPPLQNSATDDSNGSGALPMLVEFSYPPAESADEIEVPDTYRLLIEVSWLTGGQRFLRQLSLLPDETRRVEVGYGDVNIRTALGDIITLSPRFDYDFMLLYDTAAEGLAKNILERLERQPWQGKTLDLAASTLDPSLLSSSDWEKLDVDFALSRKIGWASSNSATLTRLEQLRPEPMDQLDWLIPILGESIGPISSGAAIIVFNGPGGFEAGFRLLWQAITGEELPRPTPAIEPVGSPERAGIRIFVSYATRDKKLRDLLLRHLEPLVTEGLLDGEFSDYHTLSAGQDWQSEILRELATSQIILLLVSADYLASAYGRAEAEVAMQRHRSGDARVIPVILTPSMWSQSSFSKLQALPDDGRPVSTWKRRDEAFVNIADGVRRVAEELQRSSGRTITSTFLPRPPIIGFVTRRESDGSDLVERLKERLAAERRTIALVGVGGAGKTTIAAETARRLLSAHEGRIVWTSADGRPDFGLSTLLNEIAFQLGSPELRSLSLKERVEDIANLLADAPSLVVLDNYETIATNEKQDLQSWLENAPCSVLITSRQQIDRALNQPVPTLSSAEAEEFLDRFVDQSTNPRLFTDRTREQIYETTQGNPLVMQWVVRQVDLGQKLDLVLHELTTGTSEPALAVFDRAFDLPQLGDNGRAAVLALSQFVPSADRAALATVAGVGTDSADLNEAVKQATALSLIEVTHGDRLTVTGLVRDLAGARLSRDNRATQIRSRFVNYYRGYAEAHRQPTAEAYEALETEKENILRAADTAFDIEDLTGAVHIAEVMTNPSGMLAVRGYWDEALRLAERALQTVRSLRDVGATARFSQTVAVMLANRGELDEARRYFDETLETNRKLGNESGIAISLDQLGRLAQEEGDLYEAGRLYNQALEIFKKLGNETDIASTLHQLGRLAQDQGTLDEARDLYNQALAINRKLANQRGIATTLHQLGMLAHDQDKFAEAEDLYRQSLQIDEMLGNQSGTANTVNQLGVLAQERQDFAQAREYYEASLNIFTRIGSQRGNADALYRLGLLAQTTGDEYEAKRLLQESLNIFEKLRSPYAGRVRTALNSLESGNLE